MITHTNRWYRCTIAWSTSKKLLHEPHSTFPSQFHLHHKWLRHCFQHSTITKDHVWRSITILHRNPQRMQVTVGWSPWQCLISPPTITKATFSFMHGIGTILIFKDNFLQRGNANYNNMRQWWSNTHVVYSSSWQTLLSIHHLSQGGSGDVFVISWFRL